MFVIIVLAFVENQYDPILQSGSQGLESVIYLPQFS